MERGDNYPDIPASASPYHATAPREHPQRRHSFLHPKRSFTSATFTAPAPAHRTTHRSQNAVPSPSHWQMALFRATAPPILFGILIAGLLVELRTRLATPIPAALPGITVSVLADTALQRGLIWAESFWPGLWALPLLCAGALGALRTAIWAGVTVFDSFVDGVDASRATRVQVGRWEDGGSVSGSELLVEMFT